MNQFATTPAEITKLAHSIMGADDTGATGRATYLKSMLAVLQTDLGGKPVLRVQGRSKRPEIEAAVQAFEKIHETFYAAVLAAVPVELDAAGRQSRTSFARSASATLRRALKTGWNPLATAAPAVTKGLLAAWTREHSTPRPLPVGAAETRVVGLAERIAEIVGALPKEDGSRVLNAALEALGQPAPQALRPISLRRHEQRLNA